MSVTRYITPPIDIGHSPDEPIDVTDYNNVSVRLVDPLNQRPPNPQAIPSKGPNAFGIPLTNVDTITIGGNGPKPNTTILNYESWQPGKPMRFVYLYYYASRNQVPNPMHEPPDYVVDLWFVLPHEWQEPEPPPRPAPTEPPGQPPWPQAPADPPPPSVEVVLVPLAEYQAKLDEIIDDCTRTIQNAETLLDRVPDE